MASFYVYYDLRFAISEVNNEKKKKSRPPHTTPHPGGPGRPLGGWPDGRSLGRLGATLPRLLTVVGDRWP